MVAFESISIDTGMLLKLRVANDFGLLHTGEQPFQLLGGFLGLFSDRSITIDFDGSLGNIRASPEDAEVLSFDGTLAVAGPHFDSYNCLAGQRITLQALIENVITFDIYWQAHRRTSI